MPFSDTVEGIQVSLNLRGDYKMCDPAYQYLKNEDLITSEYNNARVKIIAGESLGRAAYTITRTPSLLLIFDLDKNTEVLQEIPQGWNAVLYVLSGKISVLDEEIKAKQGATLSQ